MEILFLGTGASVPSRDRSTSCIALRYGSDVLLMDCGEGSQRQLMISPFSFMKIRAILITHAHGDHVLGLPGLLQTMGLLGRKERLDVYGPKGVDEFIRSSTASTGGEIPYELEFHVTAPGDGFEAGPFKIRAFGTDHGIPSMGYSVSEPDKPGRLDRGKALSLGIEDGPDMSRLKNGETVKGVRPEQVVGPPVKGVRAVYTGDTRPSPELEEESEGADVIIHESTYVDADSALADSHFHSTAGQAARTAAKAGARLLILTHVSNRYDDSRDEVLAEARRFFPDSDLAEDFDLYEINAKSVKRPSRDLG
jgi:ribonuclease Z